VGGDQLDIQLDRPVQGMGLYVIVENDELDPAFFKLTISGGKSVGSATSPLTILSDGSVYFLGIIDEAGFESVSLRSASIDDLVFNIDDAVLLDTATVPEPDALMLLAVGASALFALPGGPPPLAFSSARAGCARLAAQMSRASAGRRRCVICLSMID
jgi:hypothetical protein